MATTRRLVEVPIVVDMPPIRMALLTGMSVREAGIPPRDASAARMGSISTSTGVSLTIMLSSIARTRVTSSPTCRLKRQTLVSSRDVGSSAPVVTSPRPMIISAQIVISA